MTTVGYIFNLTDLLKISSVEDIETYIHLNVQNQIQLETLMYNLYISIITALQKSIDLQGDDFPLLTNVLWNITCVLNKYIKTFSQETKDKLNRYKSEVIKILRTVDNYHIKEISKRCLVDE